MKDDEIKENILAIAKKEFMEKGFLEASMRNISAKSGVTTGSLYNRFKDKEELFGAIVLDKANELLKIFTHYQDDFASLSANDQFSNLSSYVDDKLVVMINYIYDNFDIFKLIICKSKGSKFENYIESFISIEQENTKRYIHDLSSNGISINMISEDINHILASSLFNGFFQIVDHDYSKEEAIKYVFSLYQFFRAGWNKLLY